MEPQLSVIIPLFNQGSTIETALDSLAAQRLALEIILVDDGSTDDGPARVHNWSEAHPPVPLRILRHEQHRYALAGRLTGLAAAAAPDILFMDGDDVLLGTRRLARALERKQLEDCEIVHFRTQGVTPDGEEVGEALFCAPLGHDVLRGADVFTAFAARHYPPAQLWNKIYSRSLLERVVPLAQGRNIFYFDDKFLVSLIMLHTRSYAGCNEYVYRYHYNPNWPMEKYAKCVHDLLELRDVITPLMRTMTTTETARRFQMFLNRRLTINAGKLCMEVERLLFAGEKPAAVLEKLTPFLDEERLFAATLLFSRANALAVHRTLDRIIHEF